MMISWGAVGVGKPLFGSMLGVSMGTCQLPTDPSLAEKIMEGSACLHLRASEDLATSVGHDDGVMKVASGFGSVSFHFSPWFALQAQGLVRGISRFSAEAQRWDILPSGIQRRTDHAVVRLGNPSLHKFRASLGNQKLPFGIDANPADDVFVPVEDRGYWGQATSSAVVTYDNLVDTQVDVGVSRDSGKSAKDQHATGRLIYDLSFFERARIVLSAASKFDVVRGGFGFVSRSRSGDTTQIEWIYSTEKNTDLNLSYRRLFRFGFETAERRWWFLYDEDHARFQTVATGYRHFFAVSGHDLVALRFSLGRIRSFNERLSGRLIASAGVEVDL